MSRQAQDARPILFDTHLLPDRRDRAARLGFAERGDFLHREVAGLLTDRLSDVLRDFRTVSLIGTGGGVYREALTRPGREISEVELSPARAGAAGVAPVGTLDPIPLAPESCDLAISALEMHWANDPVGHLIQMRRALQPDGLMIAALFGGQTLHELRAVLAEAEVETTGGLSPRVAPMAELRDLGALLQRAGFAMPVADAERLTVTYPDIIALMRDLRCMGETNIMTERRRTGLRRETLRRAGELYANAFPAPGGRLVATFEVVFLTGWTPGENQPKPLRPGSAKMRLADALGTIEQTAGEPTRPDKPGST